MKRSDLLRLAELHIFALPNSLISLLGKSYVRAFYRYVQHSPYEFLVVERNVNEKIIGGCVVSLDPLGLDSRLLFKTPLILLFLFSILRVLPSLLMGLKRSTSALILNIPELILIYTDAHERGKGIGTSLVKKAEAELAARGILKYQVKTFADPENAALSFYDKLGFERFVIVDKQGKRFQVFTKTINSNLV